MNEIDPGDWGSAEADFDSSSASSFESDAYSEIDAAVDSDTPNASATDDAADWEAILDTTFPEESDNSLAEDDGQDLSGDWRALSVQEAQEKLGRDTLWEGDVKERGRDFEALDGANIGGNFPIIDDYDPDTGVATSCKSLDLSADSYQSQADLSRRVMDYLDDLSGFKEGPNFTWKVDGEPVVINKENVGKLQLDLAIPQETASDDQLSVLMSLQDYAADCGLRLNVIEMP